MLGRSVAAVSTLLLVAMAALEADCAILADEVQELPGWPGKLPSKLYSGYLSVPGDYGQKHYHYIFAESESDPQNDPIALWLNGGPGSSSLIGWLTENGQYMTDERSVAEPLPWGKGNDSVPQLFRREFSWTKIASVIWLESPAGVGFSFCDYPQRNKTTGLPLHSCTANDTSTAADNLAVLKAFFAGFPEFQHNPFFITGESYAGIYIPMLAELILNEKSINFNFTGMSIGNGCWGSAVGLCSFGPDMYRVWHQFLYGHSAISTEGFQNVNRACGDPLNGPGSWSNCSGMGAQCSGPYGSMLRPSDQFASDDCQGNLSKLSKDEYPGNYNIYDIYDTCYANHGMTQQQREDHLESIRAGGQFGAAVLFGQTAATLGGALNDYSCGGMSAMSPWLAHPAVMKALHVNASHPYPGAVKYGPRTAGDLRPLYKELAAKIRVMIYSGDTDACVPTVGTEEWVKGLGFPKIEDWRPWHAGTNENSSDHFITAGYVTVYNAAAPAGSFQSAHSLSTCPLFARPNCTIPGGDVIGFSTVVDRIGCCFACNKSIGCRYFEYRPADHGCTLYEDITAMKTDAGTAFCGSYVPPPHNFTFITVKGAGHTVPEIKPVPALRMITQFFRGQQHT